VQREHNFLLQISPLLSSAIRYYGTKDTPPTLEEITERVMNVLKAYDKILAEKV
jgi:hypothetical protein